MKDSGPPCWIVYLQSKTINKKKTTIGHTHRQTGVCVCVCLCVYVYAYVLVCGCVLNCVGDCVFECVGLGKR